MDLKIKKDKRNNGCFFRKMGEVKSNKEIKNIALKDISEECGDGKFYSEHYISRESQVLSTCKMIIIIIPIDTTIY